MIETTPLTGKEFEQRIVARLDRMREDREASIGRPGVHAITLQRFNDGTVQARLIPSLPDFQGVLRVPHTEVVFDGKVCSGASWILSDYRIQFRKTKSRQLRHLYERASFGSVCFFLVHWNERKLKTKTEPAATYAFPVAEDHPFWVAFESGAEKVMKRSHCETYAVPVRWNTVGQEQIARPDVLEGIRSLMRMRENNSAGAFRPRRLVMAGSN